MLFSKRGSSARWAIGMSCRAQGTIILMQLASGHESGLAPAILLQKPDAKIPPTPATSSGGGSGGSGSSSVRCAPRVIWYANRVPCADRLARRASASAPVLGGGAATGLELQRTSENCAKAALVTGADEMYVRLAGMRCPDQRLRGLIMLGRRGPPSGTSDPVTEPGADEWAASFGRLGTASSPPSALEGRFCCLACGTAERTLLSFCALCSASASNARSCCSDDGSSDWRQARALKSAIDTADDYGGSPTNFNRLFCNNRLSSRK